MMLLATKQLPTCPVCFNIYDDSSTIPKSVACGNGHTVCSKCLESILKENRKCPLCRATLALQPIEMYRTEQGLLQHLQKCKGRCSKCHLQGDEGMFVVCKTCSFADPADCEMESNKSPFLDQIELYAICFACVMKEHSDHDLVSLIVLRARKVASDLKKSPVSYELQRTKIANVTSEIVASLLETQQLSNSLWKLAEHAGSSEILERIKKTFKDDAKSIHDSSTALQTSALEQFLTRLKMKMQTQKDFIAELKTLCKPPPKPVNPVPEVQFHLPIVYCFHFFFALMQLLCWKLLETKKGFVGWRKNQS